MLGWLLFCLSGFLLLYFSAEWLVKGASSLARNMGLSPIVIGLTVVAFGTSAPELVVCVISSMQGKSMIVLGNVVGSNICNIGLVLGLAAVFQPIKYSEDVVKREIPLLLGIYVFFFILSLNSIIGRIEGAILFAGIIAYTLINYKLALKQRSGCYDSSAAGYEEELKEIGYVESRRKQIVYIVAGTIGVAAGAQIVVESAVKIMTVLGVGEKIISLTLVAFGTSLPELTTSIVAAVRKEMDISIGNLLGSNVFNILSVMGLSSLVRSIIIPGGILESGLIKDYIVMMFICIVPWVNMRKDYTMKRGNGLALLVFYTGYIISLFYKA